MALSDQQESTLHTCLSDADSSVISNNIPRLISHWSQGNWLSINNPYKVNPINRINQFNRSQIVSNDPHLLDYIAASAFVHSFDGWSYLGRAIDAEIAGDPDTARHLGYYAELRAAMSFLACQGVGVFNRKHIVITSSRNCKLVSLNLGTHEFVWNALSILTNQSDGYNSVLSSIKPYGVSLSDWLKHFSVSGYHFVPIWLQQWGFDIFQLTKDKQARNMASYRPTTFTSSGPRPLNDTLEGLLQFWKTCDPNAQGGFPILDLHLLKSCFNEIFLNSLNLRQSLYKHQLKNVINKVGLSNQSRSLKKFLSYSNLSNILGIIREAQKRDDITHPNHSEQVLARATLLLRVATGCSANLLVGTSSSEKDNLYRFWSSRSIRRRMWAPSVIPDSFNDLWLEIEESSKEIRDWLDMSGNNVCRYDLCVQQATPAAMLTTTERAFLWGIGI